MGKGLDKFLNMMRLTDDDYDDYDDYDDDNGYEAEDYYETPPAPAPKRRSSRKSESYTDSVKEKAYEQESATPLSKSNSRNNGKIIPLKSHNRGMEVCVLRPTSFDDSREITEVLLTGRAAVISLEGIDIEAAQRIIDFVSGSCYAMSGNIQKISSYIFIVTPESIDISGDVQSALTSTTIDVPAFRLNI